MEPKNEKCKANPKLIVDGPEHQTGEINQMAASSIHANKKKCKTITTKLLKNCLRPAGLQRNINRKILYASMGTMGIQMPCIYTTMGIQKIKHLLNNGGKNNLCGEMIQLSYEQTIRELGINGNLFKEKYQKWQNIVTKTWITHCWQFCSENMIPKPRPKTTK